MVAQKFGHRIQMNPVFGCPEFETPLYSVLLNVCRQLLTLVSIRHGRYSAHLVLAPLWIGIIHGIRDKCILLLLLKLLLLRVYSCHSCSYNCRRGLTHGNSVCLCKLLLKMIGFLSCSS